MFTTVSEMKWFANLKVAELKAELKKRGFKGYSKMKKGELQDALLSIMEQEYEEKTRQDDEELEELLEEADESFEEVKWDAEEFSKDMNDLAYDIAQMILDERLKGKLLVPIEGNEDKAKKMHRDLAKLYHPDRPTGDTEMMQFVNEMFENMKNN